MASMYQIPPDNILNEAPRASQACATCRKQKRKCSKDLPQCALCKRMGRICDYSDSSPAPTSDDFNALRTRVIELEGRLNAGNSMAHTPPFATPSSLANGADGMPAQQVQAYSTAPQQDSAWHTIQNRFPAIAVLDILEILGDVSVIQPMLTEYFNTIHKWYPIISQKRLDLNLVNPFWEAGPDLALLFLCMKLITSRPVDGLECAQNPVYITAKRFIALMEAAGMVSLLVLQSNILVTLYEYGQAIYPAAWMSAGWCVRYGTLLGINGFDESPQLLGPLGTRTEYEERVRTWWGVLIIDRMVSIGSKAHILTAQEPQKGDPLPADDIAWDNGDVMLQRYVSNPVSEPVSPFTRLCQGSVMLGKVLRHHYAEDIPSETARFSIASQLYIDCSILARKIDEEASDSTEYLTLATSLALIYSTLNALCEPYTCTAKKSGTSPPSPERAAMTVQALDGLKSVSNSSVEFADKLINGTPTQQDLDKVSPLIMDALYSAASNYAWLVRESGDQQYQAALDSIRHCLRRLGSRWRNAAEYLRILEAQEFTYAVGSAN
ncbi:fungal specific transcription factor domain-containing protein [Rutstroemia sp. NJR-2017a WRK4]|nr:fungal specific transcription factor domain-containing protein [Rutstroemia sp. NJR-2017a WRK4]